jgi:threonine dehydratase
MPPEVGPRPWPVEVSLPSLDGIRDAARRIRADHMVTPLIRSELLSSAFEADIWLKNETVSPVASFKLRGALTALLRARERGTVAGAVSSSTGNHGQGVAYAARLLDLPCTVFLPDNANPVKRAMIAALGAAVHEVGHDIDAAKAQALAFCEAQGHVFVDDGESVDVIEGAGTVGLEVAEALADMRGLQPKAKVIAVQAKGSAALHDSFHAGRPIARDIDTIAEGLTTRIPPTHALTAMLAFVNDSWLTDDGAMLSAIRTLAECAHVLVEPAGAATMAAAWSHRAELVGRRVVLVLSGANIAPEHLRAAVNAEPSFSLETASRRG